MRQFVTVLIIFIQFSNASFANFIEGNGGDVIVCPQSGTKLLDFYEAEVMKGLTMDLGGDGLSVAEKVELVWQRLDMFDQERADRYRSWTRTLADERKFVDVPLPDVVDSDYIFRLPACRIAQVAVQRPPRRAFEKRYFFNRAHWDGMISNDHRAGLIIHAVVYRDALERGHHNAISTRDLTALLASSVFSSLEPEEYRQVILANDFNSYQYSKIEFNRLAKIYRYFPAGKNYVQSVNFCRKLSPGSVIVDFAPYFGGKWGNFKKSAIGKAILGPDRDRIKNLWFRFSGEARLFKVGPTPEIIVQPDPNSEHGVLCMEVF